MLCTLVISLKIFGLVFGVDKVATYVARQGNQRGRQFEAQHCQARHCKRCQDNLITIYLDIIIIFFL